MKNKRKVRRRDVQIIRALDLWFIRHKKQGCNNIAIVKNFEIRTVISSEAFAESVIKPERIDIKKKNTWHKKNWQRR